MNIKHDHRNDILALLEAYKPYSDSQIQQKKEHIHFIKNTPLCFYRSCFDDGHIATSCVIINYERTHILLHYHKKLCKWMQFGGHCDGNPDMFDVIRREVLEETGIDTQLIKWYPELIAVGKFTVPEHNTEPQHYHYDMVFAAFVPINTPLKPDNNESTMFRWVAFEELYSQEYSDTSVLREWCETVKTLPRDVVCNI